MISHLDCIIRNGITRRVVHDVIPQRRGHDNRRQFRRGSEFFPTSRDEPGKLQTSLRTPNGEPFVVSAMREVPLELNEACLKFAADLLEGRFDLILFNGTLSYHRFTTA